jgi:uncharacterized phage infection (PIP) family protein YhgE
MNASQKKTLTKQTEELNAAMEQLGKLADPKETLKTLAGQIDDVKTAVEGIRDEISEKLDNMSEKQKEGDKADELNTAKEALDEVVEKLETAATDLQDDNIGDLSLDELGEKLTEIKDGLDEAVDKINEL